MLKTKSLASVASALATLTMTSLAVACPVCAQREEDGVLRYTALAVLVILPWILGGAAYVFIRRALRTENLPPNVPETT